MAERVNPHRITVALDMAKLFGPNADRKLGAREPALDMWEAGAAQPTAAQLDKLGELANLTREFFFLPDDAAPEIIVARVMTTRRRCMPMVTLRGEVPEDYRRQGSLL